MVSLGFEPVLQDERSRKSLDGSDDSHELSRPITILKLCISFFPIQCKKNLPRCTPTILNVGLHCLHLVRTSRVYIPKWL